MRVRHFAFCCLVAVSLVSAAFAQVPSSDPAGIFDGRGNFNSEAYVRMAAQYGTAAMIPERFGSSWSAYHSSLADPTWSQSLSLKYTNPVNEAEWFFYSRGLPCANDSVYSSNYAQVGYVFDSAVPASVPGVDGIETLGKSHCIWTGQSQLYWAMGSGHNGSPTITLRPDIVQKHDSCGIPHAVVEVTR